MFEFTLFLECTALTLGLIFFKRIKPGVYRVIVLLLLLTVMNEGASYLGLYASTKLKKYTFYNSFFIVQFLIIGYLYASVITNKSIRLFIKSLTIIVTIISVLLLNSTGFGKLNIDFITLNSSILIVYGILYLYTIYKKDSLHNMKTDPVFWFTIGLVIAQFLLLLFINALRIESFRKDENSMNVFKYLNTLGNIIYYFSISYSFLCTSKSLKPAGT